MKGKPCHLLLHKSLTMASSRSYILYPINSDVLVYVLQHLYVMRSFCMRFAVEYAGSAHK
jgi:hypothetical protein